MPCSWRVNSSLLSEFYNSEECIESDGDMLSNCVVWGWRDGSVAESTVTLPEDQRSSPSTRVVT